MNVQLGGEKMKYCRWKIYGNLSTKIIHFFCVKCCHTCREKCSGVWVCEASPCCNLVLTELEYLLVKLANKPLEVLEEEGLVRT